MAEQVVEPENLSFARSGRFRIILGGWLDVSGSARSARRARGRRFVGRKRSRDCFIRPVGLGRVEQAQHRLASLDGALERPPALA